MVGRTIEATPRAVPLGPCLALAVAALPLGLAVATGTAHWAVAALLPAMVALFWWLFRERPFRAELTEEGLEIAEPPRSVPYASIEGLQARRPPNPYKAGPPCYAIRVIHSQGALEIPARLNVPSDEVYSFLYHRLSSSGSRDVNPALADYLRDKQRRHGPERVWTYVGRSYRGGGLLSRRWLLWWLACLATGPLWLAAAFVLAEPVWGGGGVLLCLCGGIFALAVWSSARGGPARPRKRGRASLVICPDGLALAQGSLVGQLRWDEIRRVRLAGGVITLKLEGAEVRIADIYDRPLPLIRQLLDYYHEGGREDERPAWRFDAARLRDADHDSAREAGRYAPRPQGYQE
jgi:hypothetical protein